MLDAIEIKPCPFCGGEAKLITGIETTKVFGVDHPCFQVCCRDCGAETKKLIDTSRDGSALINAVKNWNKRIGEENGI